MPANQFGALAGKLNGPLSDADNNHVFIPVFVPSSAAHGAGVWKIAFNVESNAPPLAAEYCVLDEAVTASAFPGPGFVGNARLSYRDLGLKQSQFKIIANGTLRTIVHSSVSQAEVIQAYGVTFPGGLHDIHYNNGEPANSGHANHPHQDGALALYFHEASGQAIRRWIFIKFQSQTL